jgi:hypothetical protein
MVEGNQTSLPHGQVCGGWMKVIFDEAVQADSGPPEKWKMLANLRSAQRNAA